MCRKRNIMVVCIILGLCLIGVCMGVLALKPDNEGKTAPIERNYIQYMTYETVEELMQEADAVVTARVLSSQPEKIDVAQSEGDSLVLDFDVYDVEIIASAKGNLTKGEKIQVKQIQGEEGFKNYQAGDEAIFMLADYTDYNIPYSLINPTQGHIDVDVKKDTIEYYYYDQTAQSSKKGYSALWEEMTAKAI